MKKAIKTNSSRNRIPFHHFFHLNTFGRDSLHDNLTTSQLKLIDFFIFFLFSFIIWKWYDLWSTVTPGDKWCHGKLEFMLSQRGKPLLVHDGHSFGIQYIRKDKKYWQCNLSRKFNCKARVTTTDTGEIIVTNNEHCHTEIRQHLKKDYKNRLMLNALTQFNHHLTASAMSGNGLTEAINLNTNNNNSSSNNNNNNNTGSSRTTTPPATSNGGWNLKKEIN